MKKLNVKNNVFLIAQESWKGCRKLDYYLILKNGKKYYAFSRDYSRRCHILCQGATPVNTILKIREHNAVHPVRVNGLTPLGDGKDDQVLF